MKFVSFFIGFLFVLPVVSQIDGEYTKFIYYNKEDGLSQNAITAIVKDDFGFMWIATKDGLNKFDGERFSIFKHQEEDSTSLDDNHIYSLESDTNGGIWIGTRRGINFYDPFTKKVKRFTAPLMKDSNPANIRAIRKINDEMIWFASFTDIFCFNKSNNVLQKIKFTGLPNESVNHLNFYSIFRDSKNQIWLGTNRGLYQVEQKNEAEAYLTPIPSSETYKESTIKDIIEDRKGDLWLGTDNKGLLKYDRASNQIRNVTHKNVPILDIRKLAFDNDQNLWIACFKGLVIIKKDGTIINPKNTNKRGEIISDGLTSLYTDEKGSVWLGGHFGGLRIWNKYFNRFKMLSSLRPRVNTDLGLVNAITEDEKGFIYVGTKKNGVVVLNKNKSINYQLTSKLTEKLKDITVKAFLVEKNLLWIATLKNGILVYDTYQQKFLPGLISEELQNHLKQSKLYSIAKSDEILVCGTFGDGIYIYNLLENNISHIPFETTLENDKNSVLGNVPVVHFDTVKNLWIGSITGLKNISSQNFKNQDYAIKRYDLSKKPADLTVKTFSENAEEELIIGGSEDIYIYKNSSFEHIDFSENGIEISTISSVIQDDRGILWLATNAGIIKYNPDSGSADLFDQNRSLLRSEFRNHSYLKSSDGTIFLGTSTGVIYFDPEEITYEKPESEVVLTAIKIQGNEETDLTDFIQPKTTSDTTSGISLVHDQNSFTIQFSSLNFAKILKNSYEYRLLGLNDTWKTTSNPEVTYTLQKSGNYTFQVRKAKLSGIGVNQITSLPIYLEAAPWKSWYAILSYILLTALFMYIVYRTLKSRTELQHQLELENLEKRKEKERYTSQIEFFTNLSHDFRTPLTLILAPLNQLLEKYRGSSNVYNNLLGIRRNADQLLVLINQLLDFRKIDAKDSKLKCSKNDIVQSLTNVFLSFEDFAELHGYTYNLTTSSDQIYMYYDAFVLERVFYNLISNAFKNTGKGGKIKITIEEQEENVVINIIDNGKGIDQEMIASIFERFYKITDQPRYKEHFSTGTGIGLHIAKKAIDLHKGSIQVESAKDKGSTFRVMLRKGTEHLSNHHIMQDEIYPSMMDPQNPLTELSINEKEVEFLFPEADQTDSKPTILIVEDNEELRKYIVDNLKIYFKIEQANDGSKGFHKAIQKKVDLIISDVMMPELSGTELCRKIKNDERTSHIPVILLTSRSSNDHKIEGLESGADAYITKPFVLKEFLLTIKNILATHLQSREKYNSSEDTADDNGYEVASEDEKLYKMAMKIIKENINNSSFEVNEFCAQLGINRTKLFKKIKEWTGQTPKEFIQFVRLKKASQLLERGDLSISTVCYEVGFASPHYFARCFKKQYKQTPSEYANKFHSN